MGAGKWIGKLPSIDLYSLCVRLPLYSHIHRPVGYLIRLHSEWLHFGPGSTFPNITRRTLQNGWQLKKMTATHAVDGPLDAALRAQMTLYFFSPVAPEEWSTGVELRSAEWSVVKLYRDDH